MHNPAERPNTVYWPPLAYLAAFILPSILQRVLPLPIIELPGFFEEAMVGVGLALLATGFTIDFLALRSFNAVGTPFNPTAKAETLVSFGLYNRSRNPMYLGAMIGFLGLAIATGNIWRWIALAPLAWVLHVKAALREEAHLEARFGEAWRDYAAKVPRWW
jgi:protein-S-isoprenylcysteine O-methyltransferase Ste14